MSTEQQDKTERVWRSDVGDGMGTLILDRAPDETPDRNDADDDDADRQTEAARAKRDQTVANDWQTRPAGYATATAPALARRDATDGEQDIDDLRRKRDEWAATVHRTGTRDGF